jgi:hypothetical protein
MLSGTVAPDGLSEWILPPPAAREAGEVEPIRVFETAEEALRFLAGQNGDQERPSRYLAQSPERVKTARRYSLRDSS